ncbi:54S ribosomal protein L4 mitochondrial [Arachnomyces sp. PD_36]|nr:54S ribosomal protein L4 mitochondrial [Arachnomyces sp. PD_36]
MSRQSVSKVLHQYGASSRVELPPPFLAPALHFPLISSSIQTSRFSTTHAVAAREKSKLRGVSAIHRTGPRRPLLVSKHPLPRPVENPEKRETTPNHGLWGFFGDDKSALIPPADEHSHGRSWTIEELRQKSWDDLYSLWWVCVKERNRIATSNSERERLQAGYGEYEANHRDETVRVTQKAIKHVLRERYYAWTEARELYNQGYRPDAEEIQEEEKFT